MPYKPPHLRGGGGSKDEAPPPPTGGRRAMPPPGDNSSFSSFSTCRRGGDEYGDSRGGRGGGGYNDGRERGGAGRYAAEEFSSFGSCGRRGRDEGYAGRGAGGMDYGDNFSGRRGDGYGNERVDRDRAYPESYSSFERREKERGHYDERGGSGGGRERQGDGRYSGSPSFNGDGGEHANGRTRGAPSSAGGAAAAREPWKPSSRVQNLTPEQVKEIRDRLNLTVEEPEGGDYGSIPSAIESFEDMNLHASVLKDIHDHGYNRPTPIQCQAIPVSLAGNDILGCAETGSGKTASFSIPMIQHVVLAREEGGGVGARGGGPLSLIHI